VITMNLFGKIWTWRSLFIAEAFLMVPFIIVVIFARGPKNIKEVEDRLNPTASSPSSHQKPQKTFGAVWSDAKTLIQNPVYMLIVLGYAAQTFVVGGFAFFGLKYAEKYLKYSKFEGGIYFGGVGVFTGVFGTASGGFILDLLRRRYGGDTTSSLVYAFQIMVTVSYLGIPLCIAPFVFKLERFYFFVFLLVGEFLLFCSLSPTNSAMLWAVPVSIQPLAVALGIVLVHCLGDAISPVIIGRILDATNQDWQLAMTILVLALVPSSLVWSWGLILAMRKQNQERSFSESKVGLLGHSSVSVSETQA